VPIEIIVDRQKNRTTHITTGNVTFKEALAATEQFFDNHVTRDLLLDMSQGSLELITSKELERLTLYFGTRAKRRPENPRTALVANDTLNYGLSRLMQITAELDNSRTRFIIFRDIASAEAWLDKPPDPAPATCEPR